MTIRFSEWLDRLLQSLPPVRRARAELHSAREQLNVEHADVVQLRAQLGSALSAIKDLRIKHEDVVKALHNEHDKKMKELQNNYDAAVAEIKKWKVRDEKHRLDNEILRQDLAVNSHIAADWRTLLVDRIHTNAHPAALAPVHNTLPPYPPSTRPRSGTVETAQPSRPLLSVVLRTNGGLKLLKAAIESVRIQDFDGAMEIVVVDGSNSDGTRKWLGTQSDIVSILQDSTGEPSDTVRALNLAFMAARGKWICALTDGSILSPNCLSKAVLHAENLENEGAAVGAGAFFQRNIPGEKLYHVQHTIGGMLMVGQGMFLKEALEDVGYVDSIFSDEDRAIEDLSLKIWNAGYSVVSCTSSFVDCLVLTPAEAGASGDQTDGSAGRLPADRWDGKFESADFPEFFERPYREYASGPGSEIAQKILHSLLDEKTPVGG